MIKSYVIDTNILIQAPYACQCFEENRVILPLVVLEELDGLKKAEGEKGANARRAIRFLEKLRMKGDLLKGVELENGGFLRVEANCVGVELPESLPEDKADNRILKVCKFYRKFVIHNQHLTYDKDYLPFPPCSRFQQSAVGLRND